MLKDRFVRYMFYAIGEIVLVVAGILIALQVNNWNEARKDSRYADFILQEIHKDLVADMSLFYKGIEPRLAKKEYGAANFNAWFLSQATPENDIVEENYGHLKMDFYVTTNRASFETLKNRGIHIISSDKLRDKLIDFYDSEVPRIINFIKRYDGETRDVINKVEYQLFHPIPVKHEQGYIRYKPVASIENVIENQQFRYLISRMVTESQHKRYRFNLLIESYTSMLGEIEHFLNMRNLSFESFDRRQIVPDLEPPKD